ncbi:MAG: hypothetical protein RLZZ480_167 [Candidatus Parcubacteria bacterium]|jgi:hypothetical protein
MTTPHIVGIIGTLLVTASYVPYIYHILKRTTKPHIYTWILWSLTQAFATTAILEGGGGWFSAANVGAGAVLAFTTLLLSIKYGSRNITRFDTFALLTGFFAAIVWWYFDHPVIAISMIALIEVIGFLPTYRKTWNEPWSESILAWTLFVAGNLCALYALDEYNLLTSLYIVTMTAASFILILLSSHRRRRF